MCLMMASCSGSKPIEVSDNDQSRFEELTKELRKKAQGGDASAQNELGLLYYEGRGVGQNYRKAKEWFDKAVEQGHTGAQVNLGTLYLRGEGAPQSSQMALFWFTRAAGQEDALALAKLGLMYAEDGECCKTSFKPTCGTTSQQPVEKTDQRKLAMLLPSR
jgi:TPR repeat protein